jgi:O-antigen ligase
MNPSSGQQVNLYLNYLLVVLAFSIPVYRRWVVVAASLIIVLWFFEGRPREKALVLRHHPLTLAVLLFILVNLVSLLWSSDPARGFSYIGKYRYLLLVPVIATSLRERFRDRTLKAFLVGSTIATLFSFAVFLGLLRIGDAYAGNPSPPDMSHLDFSMILALAALLVLNRLAHSHLGWLHRGTWLGLLLLFICGLMINIGRSGQVAFAGTLMVMVPVYLTRRSSRAAAVGLAGVVAALSLAYVSIPRFHRGIETGITELVNTVTEQRYQGNFGKRIAGLIVAREMILQHPVVGTGVGDNMTEFRRLLDTRYRHLKDAVYWFPHFHNQYLQVATELGLAGLGVLLLMLLALFRGPYTSDEDRHLAIALGCAYLIGFCGDPFLHKQLPLALFATLSGVAAANGRSCFWSEDSSG